MIKVTKRTMWTLIGTSSDTPSFNPFDVSSVSITCCHVVVIVSVISTS